MYMRRGEIQAWDLQSLLIKPMQRVLKYPLLLEKLVANTSDSDSDYKVVLNARDAIAKVAQDINEIKRRKDLGEYLHVYCVLCICLFVYVCAVVKYTGAKDRGTLNVHSLQKKMRRFKQTLTQFTGLRSKVKHVTSIQII